MVNPMVDSLREGIQKYPIISDQRFSIASIIVILIVSIIGVIILWRKKRKV